MIKAVALVALVLAVAGCGWTDTTGEAEQTPRYLVYEKTVGEEGVWIADVDGNRPRMLVPDGGFPVVSPNGKLVAYFDECDESAVGCTYVVSTFRGKPRLLTTRRLDEAVTWSPTSEEIASISAFGGRESQQGGEEDELVSIDVTSGKETIVARAASFSGWTFSPDGEKVVFARSDRRADGYMSDESDLFVTAADGRETRITWTGDNSYPVWGPRSIAFRKGLSEIWQIQPDGTGRVQLTERPSGLLPIDWSEDGSVLLAGLLDNLSSHPIAVDPETGKSRELGRFGRRFGADTMALSRDGRSALIQEGFRPHVPLGEMTVLIVTDPRKRPEFVERGARMPSWNR